MIHFLISSPEPGLKNLMACNNFALDGFNCPFTNIVFTIICLTIDHYPDKTIGMYNEQVYQLRVFKFSMQVHNLFTKNKHHAKASKSFANILNRWIAGE